MSLCCIVGFGGSLSLLFWRTLSGLLGSGDAVRALALGRLC